MGLKTCPDCGKKVSDSAGDCPHCGAGLVQGWGCAFAIAILMFFFCVAAAIIVPNFWAWFGS